MIPLLTSTVRQILLTQSLENKAKSIVRRNGIAMYVPIPGVTCFQDSACTIPAAVDDPVGGLKDYLGLYPATQAASGYRPILRGNVKNYLVNSSFIGAVAGTPGTLPTNWNFPVAAGATLQIIGTGTTSAGEKYIDIRYYGTNNSGATQFPGFSSVWQKIPGVAPGMQFTASAKIALLAGAWPNGVNIQIGEVNSSGGYLTGTTNTYTSTVTNSTLTLVSKTATISHALTTNISVYPVNLVIGNGTSYDMTFRVTEPQITLGSLINPYIETQQTLPSSSPYGPYWLDFDGVDDHLLASAWSAVAPTGGNPSILLFSGVNLTTTGYKSFLTYGGYTASNARGLGFASSGTLNCGASTDYEASPTLLGRSAFVSAEHTKSSNSVDFRYNGAVYGSSTGVTTENTTASSLGIGTFPGQLTYSKIQLNCAIASPVNLSVRDIYLLEKYAGKLAGLSI